MLQPQDLAVCIVGPGQGVFLCLCGTHSPRQYPRVMPAVPGLGVEGRTMRLRFIYTIGPGHRHL